MKNIEYRFWNQNFFLGLIVSWISVTTLIVFTGLFYPKIAELKESEGLTFFVHREVEWILLFSNVNYDISRLLFLPTLIVLIIWIIPSIRKALYSKLTGFVSIYSVILLLLSVLVSSGIWMFTLFTTEELWSKQTAYSRMAEQFAIEDYSEEKYFEMKKLLSKSYGMEMVEVESPDELDYIGRKNKYNGFLRILRVSPNDEMTRMVLVTLLKFSEDINRDSEDVELVHAKIESLSGLKFTDIESAFDWLRRTAETNEWKGIPIMGFEYRPPKEM